MQHHYVVVFDTDTNEFSIDYDSASVRFVDGTVYDPQLNTWTAAYSPQELNQLDTAISDKLYALITKQGDM
jgi:hypothetical protein